MVMRLIAAAAVVFAAAAGAQPPAVQEQVSPLLGTKQVYVVRHLQKAQGEDPPLSAVGAALAERLADRLSGSGIQAIFATPTRRAMQTATPLAARLGIAIRPYDPRDPAALVRAAAVAPGNVLVVGHSNTVHDLVDRFGGTAPPPLGEGDYGTVWHIDAEGRQTRTFSIAARDALTSAPAER